MDKRAAYTMKSLEKNIMRPAPFLKWVGGKRQVLFAIKPLIPAAFNHYFEPFTGGGALFFDLHPEKATLTDLNQELIDTYISVRDNVPQVIKYLKQHIYQKEYYYRIRALNPFKLCPEERAARMIFLNKTGYNGLYRVNSKGIFNVPFGRYANPAICDEPRLLAASRALQKADISCNSFETILITARKGDFIYFDPPYIPVGEQSFVGYQKKGFGMENQEKLADIFDTLVKRGCFVMLSNSDVPWMRRRYSNYSMYPVKVSRNVNSKAHARGRTGELIITGY
jgi:DNA adenine methylase